MANQREKGAMVELGTPKVKTNNEDIGVRNDN